MKTKKRRDITIIVSHRFFLYFVQCLGILGAVFYTRVFFSSYFCSVPRLSSSDFF